MTQPWSLPSWGSAQLGTGSQALWRSAATQLLEMQGLDFFSQLIIGPLSQCRRRHSLTFIDLGVGCISPTGFQPKSLSFMHSPSGGLFYQLVLISSGSGSG